MVDLRHLRAIHMDVCSDRPELAGSLELDLYKVQKLVDTRGMSVLMIDFPDACKVLDASLSCGVLDPSKLPNSFGKRSLDHAHWLYGSLFHKLFNEFGTLYEPIDINLVLYLRQILLMYKKVKLPCPQENVDKAVNEFYRIESEMRRPTLSWNSLDFCGDTTLSFLDGYRHQDDLVSTRDICPRPLLRLLDKVSGRINFPILRPEDIVPRHGPGAVADCRDDKYSFPFYPIKLSQTFSVEVFSAANEWCFLTDSLPMSHDEPAARLIAVPKTLKGPRLIASEPVSHQFLQQGLMRWMRKNLPRSLQSCINFTNQDLSKREALEASLTGLRSTIDLSSASDRLSCWVVERAFRNNPSFLQGLYAVRTCTVVDVSSTYSYGRIFLKKYANQGSAVTFPVQSIVYAYCAIASVLYERGLSATYRNIRDVSRQVRIFGDDIILPKDASLSLSLLLTHLGLKVNMAKSHVDGHFRESCGCDALAGWDITPTYLSNIEVSATFEGISSAVEVANNAYKSGFWALARCLKDQIPAKYARMLPISHWSQSGPCHYTYQKLTLASSKGRWNTNLQRCENWTLVSKVSAVKGDRVGSQGIYQFFIDEPDPLLKWSQGYLGKSRSKIRPRWEPASCG